MNVQGDLFGPAWSELGAVAEVRRELSVLVSRARGRHSLPLRGALRLVELAFDLLQKGR